MQRPITEVVVADAAEGNVAKVGNTEYATIDEAIANWTNGTTLTLLADVTLSDVISRSSTEYHILDLGTYTMTAASNKDAIQIVNNGRSSASYALDIKADATNPGGITATGKAVLKFLNPTFITKKVGVIYKDEGYEPCIQDIKRKLTILSLEYLKYYPKDEVYDSVKKYENNNDPLIQKTAIKTIKHLENKK